ncbi:MAG: site-specific integrase [Ignavibacteriae bacterium]|nr:MAG: site-specific integrase [Ignavibacteriota bacterium]
MSTIYWNRRSENKIYYLGIKNSAGKIQWRTTHCRKKSDALSFLLNKPEVTAEPVKVMHTLSSFYELYVSLKSNLLRHKTIELHNSAQRHFLLAIGDKLLSQYTLEDVERFKNYCLDKKKTATTVNMYYRAVKSVFQSAVDNEYLQKNPFKYSKQVKQVTRKISFMQKADIEKLLAVVKNDTFKDLYLVACLTGMRLSEIVNLRWCQVDFKDSLIQVINDETFQTKTGRNRVVPMHDLVKSVLKKRRQNGGYVFNKGGYKYEASYVSRYFKRCVRVSGLNPDLHFHSTRHSAASLLCVSGVSIYEIQKILGHSSVNLTANTYSHLLPSTLVSSVNKIQF